MTPTHAVHRAHVRDWQERQGYNLMRSSPRAAASLIINHAARLTVGNYEHDLLMILGRLIVAAIPDPERICYLDERRRQYQADHTRAMRKVQA
jgi:hypothetical protein